MLGADGYTECTQTLPEGSQVFQIAEVTEEGVRMIIEERQSETYRSTSNKGIGEHCEKCSEELWCASDPVWSCIGCDARALRGVRSHYLLSCLLYSRDHPSGSIGYHAPSVILFIPREAQIIYPRLDTVECDVGPARTIRSSWPCRG
jgi:hypothetical protein